MAYFQIAIKMVNIFISGSHSPAIFMHYSTISIVGLSFKIYNNVTLAISSNNFGNWGILSIPYSNI